MRRAVGRAQAALEQKGQKVGALRFANLEKQLAGVSRMDVYQMAQYSAGLAQTISVSAEREGNARRMPHPPPPPLPQPEKITVSATVQCAFQIQP